MCTAISFKPKDHYFGRTLDLEYSYNEEVVIAPRLFPFSFLHEKKSDHHYAIIGIATICDGYPLYYDAANEKGLCIAGLNFPVNADFSNEVKKDAHNIATFELIPWILTRCESLEQAEALLKKTNITCEPFNDKMGAATLHWLISDAHGSITLECMSDGMHVYTNSIGALTNEPPFDFQINNLAWYMNLSPRAAKNRFASSIDLAAYSNGMGAIGLPGDLSSVSRFVRVAFHKLNSICGDGEEECVNQFFHILSSVEQPRGSNILDGGKPEITVYTSCINADRGIYYYTTYENRRITAIDMQEENLDAYDIIHYKLKSDSDICKANQGKGIFEPRNFPF